MHCRRRSRVYPLNPWIQSNLNEKNLLFKMWWYQSFIKITNDFSFSVFTSRVASFFSCFFLFQSLFQMAVWIEFDGQTTCLPAPASSIKRSNNDCINLLLLTEFKLITFHFHANLNNPNTIENNILRRLLLLLMNPASRNFLWIQLRSSPGH